MDKKLSVLNLLKKNCKYSAEDISSMLNIEIDEVKNIIADLEEKGAIIKYCALVNDEVIDRDRITAIIEVKVTPERGKGFDLIAEKIYSFPEVTSCFLISGDYDLFVTVEENDARDAALFVAEKLATLDGVLSTKTHFLLRRYKYEGEVMYKTKEKKRLAISP